MKKNLPLGHVLLNALLLSFFATGCTTAPEHTRGALTGAWRGQVQGSSGALAAMSGLEFMYVFNAGGTMTESSNYDASPPGPPAYGVWKKTGARQYEAKYVFFWNNPPANFEVIAKGGGWSPGGHGVLREKITLVEDGNSFASTLRLELFDQKGQPVEGGGKATGKGERIQF